MPSLPLLKSYKILVLLNPLSWQIPCHFPRRFVLGVLIQGVECGFVNVPLHNIYLSADLVTGLVAVCFIPSLHLKVFTCY